MPTKAYAGITEYMAGCDELQLQPKETMKLLEKYAKEADPQTKLELRNRIVAGNIKLVLHVAKRYSTSGIPVVDLLQEGALGLIKAVEAFDLSKKTRFSTYAVYWVRQSIGRYIRNTKGTIRIPVGTRDRAAHLMKLRDELWSELGREPTADELFERSNLTQSQFEAAQAALITYVSLDAPLYNEPWESAEYTLGDFIQAEDTSLLSPSTEEGVLEQELDRFLHDAWGLLTPREKTVLTMHYGLTPSGETHSLREIGQQLGITRERVRQIKNEALARLRKAMGDEEEAFRSMIA